MATCRGKHQAALSCSREVRRCDNCTNVGCDRVGDDECSNQGFPSRSSMHSDRGQLKPRRPSRRDRS